MDKVIELANKLEQQQEEVQKTRDLLESALREAGLGTMGQDPATNVVYKVVEPKGTYMYYRNIDYVRTVKTGERAGSLSKKEAEAAGYTV